jgi:hypothetical protein
LIASGCLSGGREDLLGDRLARGSTSAVRLPYGPMDWTVLLFHLFWDSWIHKRDVLLARGAERTGGRHGPRRPRPGSCKP